MRVLQDRKSAGILSLTILVAATYLLSRLSSSHYAGTPFYLTLVTTLTASFNISILCAWLAFGLEIGIAVSVLSALIVLLIDLRIEHYHYVSYAIQYAVATFFAYRFYLTRKRVESDGLLHIEKLDETFNELSGLAADCQRSITSLEDRLNRYSLLKEVVESFSTILLTERITNLIVDKTLLTIGKTGRALLFLVNPEKQELMLLASRDTGRVKTKKGDLFDHWVMRHRKSLIIEDRATDFRFPTDSLDDSRTAFRSLISSPLVNGDKVIGILRLDSPEGLVFTQDDLRLLDIIAHLAAVSVQNALLYTKTQEMAIKDGLTGLFVRRYFMERFQEEIKRTVIKKGVLSVLMIDIDHFKEYNDRYGHTAGDLVLKHLARIVTSMTREGDIVARYGGEEIVILLGGRDKAQASLEAEEIRRAIKNKPLILRRHDTTVSVSIGVASYPDDGVSEDGLISVADERLYKAKAEGRDKVVSS